MSFATKNHGSFDELVNQEPSLRATILWDQTWFPRLGTFPARKTNDKSIPIYEIPAGKRLRSYGKWPCLQWTVIMNSPISIVTLHPDRAGLDYQATRHHVQLAWESDTAELPKFSPENGQVLVDFLIAGWQGPSKIALLLSTSVVRCPMNSMGDLSSSLCKRLPEGKQKQCPFGKK